MAALTSNGSFSSLSISGSGTKSGNITFTPPTLPDGATIISTSLTANLDISMRLGSAKVTINGSTYSSSSSLSINLGTSLISSLSVSAKGSSFLSRGTVSITNIVYTVNYVFKHTITASASEGGTISESGEIEIENGNSKTFTFSANEGYVIDTVFVDGTDIGKVNSYTFENITSNHTLSVTFKIISATLTVVNNTGIQNIVSYPTEKQLAYNESVNVIVTTPHNSNFKATENRNNIEFNKLSNQVFTFEEQTITDGFGKVTMYKYGNPTIYTDDNGDKMLYIDENTYIVADISKYNCNNLTISFDFMLTNIDSENSRCLFGINKDNVIYLDYEIYKSCFARYLKNTLEETHYVYEGSQVFENNVWYNIAYCRDGNTHYFYMNGNKILELVYENMNDVYDYIIFFASNTNRTISKKSNGYIKNILVCDTCKYKNNYIVSDELLQESNFTNNYFLYRCNDLNIFNMTYLNDNLFSLDFSYTPKIIDNNFYQNDRTVYLSKNGIKLVPQNTISSFTISFWYDITEEDISSYSYPCLVCLYNESNTYNMSLYAKHNSFSSTNLCFVKYEGGYNYKVLNLTLESNKKYFFEIEFDGITCNVYVNGTYIDNFSLNNALDIDYITIGSKHDTVDFCYPSYYGNINLVEGTISNGSDTTVYPTQYPIEDVYKYTTTLISEENINIELLRKIPVLSINNITRKKISTISGYDTSVAEFTSDTYLTEWEARATVEGQTYGHGIGTLVDSGTTLLANETATVTIDDEELTNGDVEYRISVYGKDANGVWSDE